MSTALLDYLRRQYSPADSDSELLHRFASSRDNDSFRQLVERHGPMVLGLCRRRLGEADADDAFQAVFLLLARRAAGLRRAAALASWLHGVALRVCANARISRLRRTTLESRAVPRPQPINDMTVRELLDVLDQELGRLPERDRLPLIYVYWQQRSHAETARELGLTAGALHGRLDRGRKRLASSLRRRGFDNAELRGLLVAPIGVAALTSDLVARTLPLALANAAVPAAVATLLTAGSTAKVLTAATLAIVVASAGFIGLSHADTPDEKPKLKSPVPRATAPETRPPAPPAIPKQRSLRVIVQDPQGKPLPGAKVHVSIWTNEPNFKSRADHVTDEAGAAEVQLPKTLNIIRVWASKEPFVTMFANWEQHELAAGTVLPAEYAMRLETGATAGGRILNEQGQPITGARVQVKLLGNLKPRQGDGRTRYDIWLANGADAVTTNADGRWKITNVPNDPQAELGIMVNHPDYASDEGWQRLQKAAGITTAMLRNENAVMSLKRGAIVHGQVVDPFGKPIKDAAIVIGDDPYFSSVQVKFATDAEGRFRLPTMAPKATTLTVIAAGFAPQLRKVNVQLDQPPQNFHLQKGKSIKLHIVDGQGRPVEGAYVSIVGWQGIHSLQTMHNPNQPRVPDLRIPTRSNANGDWEWLAAPDSPVAFEIELSGYGKQSFNISGGETRTITLTSHQPFTGKVTDAKTGQPVRQFAVVPINVFGKDFLSAERGHAVFQKGDMRFETSRADIPQRLRVEAMGYRSYTGPEFRLGDRGSRRLDVQLQPSAPVSGVVHDINGRPVADAEVLMATPTDEAKLFSTWSNHTTRTDASGRFAFPDPGEPFALVARNSAGAVQADFAADRHDVGILRLRPWASVRGQFQDGGKTVAGAEVALYPVRVHRVDLPRIESAIYTTTDADGRFAFDQVPPGPTCVSVSLGPWKDESYQSGPSMPLELQPAHKVELNLGSNGTMVSGKVKLTGKLPPDLNCTYSLNYLIRRAPGIAPPASIAKLGFDVRDGWRNSWQHTPEGLAYLTTLQRWFVKLAPDGQFRISGVPAGEYDLALEVYAKPDGCLVDPLARKVTRVTLTAADVARGTLALPEIDLPVVAVPGVGDKPELTFQVADGATKKLADARGKLTIVHFWASWCGPCKQQLPALRQLHERFAGKGLTTLSLALDEDHREWQAALKPLNLLWSQGRLTSPAEAGLSNVPTYWLLDSKGKIIARSGDLDQISGKVASLLP